MPYIEEFQAAIPREFAFLTERYGFELVEINPYEFQARSATLVIIMELDVDSSVLLTMRLKNDSERITFSNIIQCYDPTYKQEIWARPNKELFLPRLRASIELLQRYCTPLLQGDLTEWPRYLARKSEEQQQDELRRERRQEARDAWTANDYATVVAAYEAIEDDLAERERQILAQARAKLTEQAAANPIP